MFVIDTCCRSPVLVQAPLLLILLQLRFLPKPMGSFGCVQVMEMLDRSVGLLISPGFYVQALVPDHLLTSVSPEVVSRHNLLGERTKMPL